MSTGTDPRTDPVPHIYQLTCLVTFHRISTYLLMIQLPTSPSVGALQKNLDKLAVWEVRWDKVFSPSEMSGGTGDRIEKADQMHLQTAWSCSRDGSPVPNT